MTKTIKFEDRLQQSILLLDGAMGTMLQNADLSPEDFGGEHYDGCNEYLNVTSPHVVDRIHRDYLEAGADIIETNTFGATDIVLSDYDLEDRAEELNIAAAQLAKKAAEDFSTPDFPRYVAGAMGPTTKSLSVTGGATFDDLVHAYQEQATGLMKGGADIFLLETSQDMRNVKAAYAGIKQAETKMNIELPLIVSGTIEPMGTTLAGQTIESFYISLEHMKPTVVGLNCATGPEFMRDHLRSLSELATTYVHCYPNAGLPDEEGHYHESPESLASKLKTFAEKGWLNIVGGCCGTTPEHIKVMRDTLKDYEPRVPADSHAHAVSGIEPLIYEEDMRPLFVGERTNVIGSRKFKRLINEEAFEEASEIARAQVKRGAHVIDVCLADPDRDELEDMEKFLSYVTNKVKVPLMIDSTDAKVIEKALTYSQGKAIINSINLEDGEERFDDIIPIVKRFGAAVVVGTIDETGMAVTAERKLEVAKRSHDLLVHKYGLNPTDIIFDPLVFPVGTGDEQYIGSAEATVEGIRLIKEHLPDCLTILGVSNVSFGLPPVGREVLNAAFMYYCTKAGLDYAIVNTEKVERYASIPEEEKEMARKLLFETSDASLADFTAHYRGKKSEKKKVEKNLSLEDRLAEYIVEGTKEGLFDDLDKALQKFDEPLDIINGPLMKGMDKVGKLFNNNELIVAEVLQSAEAMKAAVAHLEPHMEQKEDDSGKGKILLATVKGDVHDIGKNLVDIILSNNGFKIVNLGIKVTSNELIEAIDQEKPDAVGLSGLLVKSAQQMVLTAQDLKNQEISIPVLVGGAALTRRFTEEKISAEYDGMVLYAKDAMNGLDIANKLAVPEERTKLQQELQEKAENRLEKGERKQKARTPEEDMPARSEVSLTVPVQTPPDLKKHVLKDFSIAHLEPYVNLQMLMGKHLGLQGKVSRLLEEKNEKALDLKEKVDALLMQAKREDLLKAHGMYQFYPAQSEGNDIVIYNNPEEKKILERFSFPRQPRAPYLCLADFIRPVESGEMDYVGFLAVTAGKGVREMSAQAKENGDYLFSHLIQATALELAEGFAEKLHQMMRDQWGIPDSPELTMEERFSAKYEGIRVSFGYPACPDLNDQAKLFRLLEPGKIGVHLTEEYMMEPEASVSAMVFAHPEARYFSVL
ncbi:methionine synthase (B12-dependent) [Alteribacillus persepolensis]|uniref:Methionine synthase n=1 Tax=Alteribacillus persepolensis TaxID=568899 RepID=A0A1G7ZIC5_9BACI|nr:methionine synthase [Alteribacillus persepolensis]SDH08365.1 methionine synthase (B12-dependent) [Alteribacillus persepolensis]